MLYETIYEMPISTGSVLQWAHMVPGVTSHRHLALVPTPAPATQAADLTAALDAGITSGSVVLLAGLTVPAVAEATVSLAARRHNIVALRCGGHGPSDAA